MKEIFRLSDLYALNSNGKIKHWVVTVQQSEDDTFHVVVEHGQKTGRHQTDTSDPVEGKNIGRSNETSPCEQAIAEATSKWSYRKDRKGYTENENGVPDTSESQLVRPMLAHKFADKSHHVEYPGFVQRKYDGTRMLARLGKKETQMWSRSCKEYSSDVLHEIHEALCKLASAVGAHCLDGELYSHEIPLNEINGAAKKLKPGKTELLEFHVYDVVCGAPFHERHAILQDIAAEIESLLGETAAIVIVPTYKIHSFEELQEKEAQFIQEGYEGLIFRSSNGVYKEGHRSKDLLKVKQFHDAEFVIVGANEGSGREKGTVVWVCRADNGSTFECRPRGTREQRREWWNNRKKYIDSELTVRYQTISPYGIPLIPVGVAIRPSWDK